MSILVDENTRVIVQGMTGAEGRFHTERMLEYETKVVGGVNPGKGGQKLLGLPVFYSAAQAKRETGADASVIFVPPAGAAEAIMEASDAGLAVVVCITDGIPALDMTRVRHFLEVRGTVLIGPN
ncbi:MAG: succinate--CoA ligase subunit alpha, partial [Thermodesulfobacteriota bacterium]